MKKQGGFTLIEMLVVIAVVSILASVVMVGVRNFQAGARDTKRVATIRNVQNLLELYYTKCGNYPGGADCKSGATVNWGALRTALNGANIIKDENDLPATNDGDAVFSYITCPGMQSYTLGVELEQGNQAAVNSPDPACDPPEITCSNVQTFCVNSP